MTSRHVVIGSVAWLWLVAAGASGQTPPAAQNKGPGADDKSRVSLDWETFKKVTGFTEDRPAPGALTIPWAEVQDLLGVKVDRMGEAKVTLSWQEFKALLEWSIRQKPDAKKAEPPADFIVSSASYKGVLTKDGADFTLDMKINVLKEKGWKRIPVLASQVAVRSVSLPPGAYLVAGAVYYELVTEQAGEIDFKASFAAAVAEQAGINRVSFPRISSSTGVLDLDVDQKDVDVKIEKGQAVAKKTDGGRTRVLAALPSDMPLVSIAWERAIPEAEKVPPKIFSENRTLLAIGDGVILGRQRVDVQVLHTAVRTLDLVVPEGASILGVSGERVRDWRVKDNLLTVHLASEILGGYSLVATFEKPAKAASVESPLLRTKDSVRETGFIGVVALSNVEISAPAAAGATAIDVRELPPDIIAMTGQPILLAFRYSGEGVKVPLAVKRHEDVGVLLTLVDSAVYTAMQTKDGRRIVKALYSVRNNRNQFLRLSMPKGADIWSAQVNGQPTRPAKDEQGRVLIPLVRSDRGSSDLAAFPVELVYVEKGAEPGVKGRMKVEFPTCLEPVTHAMASLYLPEDGSYSGFAGPMKKVDAFTRLGTLPGLEAQAPVGNMEEAQQMAQQVQEEFDKQATAAGVSPIKVQLPVNGKPCFFERILVLGDALSIEFDYSFKKGFLGF